MQVAVNLKIIDLPAVPLFVIMSHLDEIDCVNLFKTCIALRNTIKEADKKTKNRLANGFKAIKCLSNIREQKYQILDLHKFNVFYGTTIISSDDKSFTTVNSGLESEESFQVFNNHLFRNLTYPAIKLDPETNTYKNKEGTIELSKAYVSRSVDESQTKTLHVKHLGRNLDIIFDRLANTIKVTSGADILKEITTEKVEDIAVTYEHLLVLNKSGLKVYNLNSFEHYTLASIRGYSIISLNKGSQFAFVNLNRYLSLLSWEGENLEPYAVDNPIVHGAIFTAYQTGEYVKNIFKYAFRLTFYFAKSAVIVNTIIFVAAGALFVGITGGFAVIGTIALVLLITNISLLLIVSAFATFDLIHNLSRH